MTDREAMQMALEAIEGDLDTYNIPPTSRMLEAIDALRAALAETEKVEPVAWILDANDGSGSYFTFGKPEYYNGTPLYAHPTTTQEPVDAFNCPKCGRHDYGLYGSCPDCYATAVQEPKP